MQVNNSESLLSQLSNVSYREHKKIYEGSQFFKKSLTYGRNYSPHSLSQNKEYQINIEVLSNPSAFKSFQLNPQNVKIDTLYWASDQNIQGTSQNDQQVNLFGTKQQNQLERKENIKEIVSGIKIEENSPNIYNQEIEFKNDNQQIKDSSHGYSSKKQNKKQKNQTKNIPKNFGKAIIIFIQKNPQLLLPVLQSEGITHEILVSKLKKIKQKMNAISDLRNMWLMEAESKCLRMISNFFLKKHSLRYIYNSRIKTRICHVKYKKRLEEAIINPSDFNYMKQF